MQTSAAKPRLQPSSPRRRASIQALGFSFNNWRRHRSPTTRDRTFPTRVRHASISTTIRSRSRLATFAPTQLRPLEFKLLQLLVSDPGRVFSREELLEQVWEMRGDINTRTVDVHVRRLRAKLGPAADVIETVHGFGYRARRDG